MTPVLESQLQLARTLTAKMAAWERDVLAGTEAESALDAFDLERPAIEETRNRMVAAGAESAAAGFMCCLFVASAPTILMGRLTPEELEQWVADGIDQACQGDDPRIRATHFLLRGYSSMSRQRIVDASSDMETALHGFQAADDRPGVGACLLNLGNVAVMRNDFEEAEELLQAARDLFSDLGLQRGVMTATGSLSYLLIRQRRYPDAVDFAREYLALARQSRQQNDEALALGQIGTCFRHLGDTTQAADHYRQQYAVGTEISNLGVQQRAMGNLGSLYLDLGEHERAVSYHQESLNLSLRAGNLRSAATDRSNLANACLESGDPARARGLLEEALQYFRSTDELHHVATVLFNLGVAAHDLGELPEAIQFVEEAIELRTRIGDSRIASLQAALGEWRDEAAAAQTPGDAEDSNETSGIDWERVDFIYLIESDGLRFVRVYEKHSGLTFNEWWLLPGQPPQFLGVNEPADIGDRIDVSGAEARRAASNFLGR